jgi:hypothetical protein
MSLLTSARRAMLWTVDLLTPRPLEGETALAYLFRIDRIGDPGPHGTLVGVDPIDLSAVRRGDGWRVERDRSGDATFVGVHRDGRFFAAEDGARPEDGGSPLYRSHAEELWIRSRPWRRPFRKHLLPHQREELDALYARAYGERDDAPATRRA